MKNKIILCTILFCILFGAISFISAGNLTTNETIIISAEDLATNESIINETSHIINDKQANCSEELIICLDIYNSLVEDFREGVNCGTAFNLVKGMNEVLAEERDSCTEEIGGLKVYRLGFYFLFIVLIITGIVIIIAIKK